MEKHKVYSGRELLLLQQQNRKKPRKNNENVNLKSLSLISSSNEEVADNIMQKEMINNLDLQCDCNEHDVYGDNHIADTVSCDYCDNIQFCTECYNSCIELFVHHEQNCQKNIDGSSEEE